jgi:hypothetical protein
MAMALAPADVKQMHKVFDRSTPAGRAMYALYNAGENEAKMTGNAFSRRNAGRIQAQGRRTLLRKAMEPEPEPEMKKLGPAMRGEVQVPRVGRRKQPVDTAPPRPGRRTALHIIGDLEAQERSIMSEQQFDAARAATRTVDRDAEKRKLQRAHQLAGMSAKEARQMEQQIRVQRGALRKALPEADEFDTLMAEIEERHSFLTDMAALGQAAAYEATVKREIAERVQKLKEIDRRRQAAMVQARAGTTANGHGREGTDVLPGLEVFD